MDNKKSRIIYLLIISILFAFDYNLSLESKYGQGIEVSGLYETNEPGIDSSYMYNEHILDINLTNFKYNYQNK